MIDITSSNMPVSNRLKTFLKEKGIKQSVIARNSGFTLQKFNDMLNGRRIMRISDLKAILTALLPYGIDANFLFEIER